MCRLVVYRGFNRELLLACLLTRPTHSIIKQSIDSKERLMSPVNGDGFGVGWFDKVSSEPCVFLATSPAWNNANLHRLAEHMVSDLIFAHVRAASPGLHTTESNCHPFSFGRVMWMHNGDVPAYPLMKRKILLDLPAHLFDAIQGHTDSELWFMLYLQKLGVQSKTDERVFSVEQLMEAMHATVKSILEIAKEVGDPRCVLNFVVSDGATVVATRIAGPKYYASGSGWENSPAGYVMAQRDRVPRAYIIASEPLTSDARDWVVIPAQSIACITPESDFIIEPARI